MKVSESYSIQRMEYCEDSIGDASIFSSLDLNWGYWQIPFQSDEIDKTASTSHYGTFRYTVMPFELKDFPVTFQRKVNLVLSSVKLQFVLVGIDEKSFFVVRSTISAISVGS